MKTATALIVAIGAALTLALAPYSSEQPVRLESDPDQRAACIGQLLALDQEPVTAGYVVGTLNYTDRYYGGPCAALEHRLEHGWY